MPKYSGINRPYMAGEIEKTPQEKQRELDEKMKKFLAKGGKENSAPPNSTVTLFQAIVHSLRTRKGNRSG